MFLILFSFFNLFNNFFLITNVAGQPNAFHLPVLDAIPTPLLQDLPGQYSMAFNGQFGQRFPPPHNQIEPVRQEQNGQMISTYQPMIDPHNQMPSHLQINDNDHQDHFKKMLENQRQNNLNHLIIDNLNEQYDNKKVNDNKEETHSDLNGSLEALIPIPSKDPSTKYEKGNAHDLTDIPDPLNINTPLGQMVSKMEELLAKEEEDKKKKDKEEPEKEPKESEDDNQDEKTEMNQDNQENTEDDYMNANFPFYDKEKKLSNDEQSDDFKNYRTMKNANKKQPNSKKQQQQRPSDFGMKLNSKMTKRLNTGNLHQKLNQNLHKRLREKSIQKSIAKLENPKMTNLKQSSTSKLTSTSTNQNSQEVKRIVNQKLNPIYNPVGYRKQKLLQLNLASGSEKPIEIDSQKQTLKTATRKAKTQMSINQKTTEITRMPPVVSPTLKSIKKSPLISAHEQLKNIKNLTEGESKTLEHLQIDADVDPELIVKDFDTSYDAKNHDASTLDEFPSYNQLINNFENAELNTQEKFWSLDLEEIDPYKKVDFSSYFLNKDKLDNNQQMNDDLSNKQKDQLNNDELQQSDNGGVQAHQAKNSEKQYQNEAKPSRSKKMERTTIKTTTTTTPEPEEKLEINYQQETTTQQEEQQQQIVKTEKDDSLDNIEMQQYIEDSQPENLNENDEIKVDVENSSESITETPNENGSNVVERRLPPSKQRSIGSNKAMKQTAITGQSLIFDSKRLGNKKFKS